MAPVTKNCPPFRNRKGSLWHCYFHMLQLAFGCACWISMAISAKEEQLSVCAALDRLLGNRYARHKFIQEVKEHEKTYIPYKTGHEGNSLRKWSGAGSRS